MSEDLSDLESAPATDDVERTELTAANPPAEQSASGDAAEGEVTASDAAEAPPAADETAAADNEATEPEGGPSGGEAVVANQSTEQPVEQSFDFSDLNDVISSVVAAPMAALRDLDPSAFSDTDGLLDFSGASVVARDAASVHPVHGRAGDAGIVEPEANNSGGPQYDGPTAAVGLTGDARINGVLSLVKWSDSGITYAFPSFATDYEAGYPGNNPNEGFGALTVAQQAVYHDALNTSTVTTGPGGAKWSAVEGFTNLTITALVPTGNATMRAAYSTDAGSSAYAYYPSTTFYGGDAWFGPTSPRNYQNPVFGGDAWRSTIHELGHQLGLKHGHEASNGNATLIPNEFNSHEYSVMTYRSYVGHPGSGGYTNEAFGHPQSWMMLDIAALQHMYGADFTHNGGDTVYTWSTTTGQMFVNGAGQNIPGANRIFLTIWDGNGTDTYDLSNYSTNLDIDLRAGEHSTFSSVQLAYLGGGPNSGYARGNVFNALQYNGDLRSLIENAIGGSGHDVFTGNQVANVFTGNGGNDFFDGREGSDTIFGGGGADSMVLRDGHGIDNFNGGADSDWIYFNDLVGDFVVVDLTAGTYAWNGTAVGDAIDIENIVGTDLGDTIVGNASANTFLGLDGNDLLDGGLGADALYGGAGDDIFVVDDAGDSVNEFSGDGNDTVYAAVSYDLAAGQYIEVLRTTNVSGTDPINLTGNEFAQSLIGNAGSNLLNGGGGADYMWGRGGNDIYVIDDVGDYVEEAANDGYDTVYTAISFELAAASRVEELRTANVMGIDPINLTGNAIAQSLIGNAGNNLLDGNGGADWMWGRGGDDIYIVDDAGDYVEEAANDGYDTVYAALDYTLAAASRVEELRTTNVVGVDPIDLVGNGYDQSLIGNAGDNFLDGRGGADWMWGRGGNDSYVVDNAGDDVIELAGDGNDLVYVSVSYTLGAATHVETMHTTSAGGTAALNLIGNAYAQSIYGNAGNNFLDGRGGADWTWGRGGNDSYVVDNAADTVVEVAGDGTDTVYASTTYALDAGMHIEELRTTSANGTSAMNLTGNEFSQFIQGNNGDNRLYGREGADSFQGRGGSDFFVFDTALGGGNVDTILDYTIADDIIFLASSIFTGLAAGTTLAASAFHVGSAAADALDRIIYNNSTGALLFDEDGVGGSGAVQFASVSAGLPMVHSEFYIF